jgi:hypothetical protein
MGLVFLYNGFMGFNPRSSKSLISSCTSGVGVVNSLSLAKKELATAKKQIA